MRSLWSSLAITSSAPSSIFLRPIFQASATRIEYCSMVSGWVVGTISTATWLPLRVCRSFSRCDCAAISSADSVPVRSTTRPVSGGTATSANAGKAQPISSASMAALAAFIAANPVVELLGRRRIEVHLRRGRDFLLIVDREVGLFLVAEHHRRQVVREGADADIVVLHRLDIAVARHRDAVLGTLQLRHQIVKQRIRFELRVVFGDHKQSRQRAAQFALGGLEFLECCGIVDELRGGLDAA